MLGQAHRYFLEGRYADALPLLSEVVRLAPGHPDAYTTLGMSFEAQANDVALAARRHRRRDHRCQQHTTAAGTPTTTTAEALRASAAGYRAQALQMFVVAAELDRKNKVHAFASSLFRFFFFLGYPSHVCTKLLITLSTLLHTK